MNTNKRKNIKTDEYIGTYYLYFEIFMCTLVLESKLLKEDNF